MKYIIVGMGNFGAYLAKRLTDLGHEVVGDGSSCGDQSTHERL